MYRTAVLLVLLLAPAVWGDTIKMKFNEVKEVAPGVFFRYSSISPTDPSIFGGSNNIWVVFDDYVVVIDANFPKEAEDVLAAVKKTTDKPVRYVLDTHHHGDHSWGNGVWVKAGASIIAHKNCADLMKKNGLAEFLEAGKGPKGRKDIATSTYKGPTVVFEDKLVLDDGKQRVEFYQYGHSHTIGDTVAYLPKHKLLCTGDACVNGPYNYMGQSDSASWIRALEKMQQLDIKYVLPGHGLAEGKELLARQKRYFEDLRREVKKSIASGKEVEDIVKSVDLPWYKEWTTVTPAADNIKHVYNEYMGLVAPWDFELDFGILEGPSPTKADKDWTKPKKIVVFAGLPAAQLASLKKAAPEVEFLPAKTADEAAKLAAEADAVIGFARPEVVRGAGKSLRWIQGMRFGVRDETAALLKDTKITLTDVRRIDAPSVADQTFALILALTRNLLGKTKTPPAELRGKTMLLVGLGGTGEQIARRANAFGTRVIALEDISEKPSYLFALRKLSALGEALKEADVVVLALPLTEKTRGLIGAKQLAAMKKGALLVNAVHAELVDLTALTAALEKGTIAGAGLDFTGSGRGLLDGHPLAKLSNVVLTEYTGEPSAEAAERRWRLTRENVRRFAAGERLLGVVTR